MKLDFVNAMSGRQKFGNHTVLYGGLEDALKEGYVPKDGDMFFDYKIHSYPQPFAYDEKYTGWFTQPMFMTFPTRVITNTTFLKAPIPRVFFNPPKVYNVVTNIKWLIEEDVGIQHDDKHRWDIQLWGMTGGGGEVPLWTDATSTNVGMLKNLFRGKNYEVEIDIDTNYIAIGLNYVKSGAEAPKMTTQCVIAYKTAHTLIKAM